MDLSDIRITRHAPDSATLGAALRWRNHRKWQNLGQHADTIWGETAIPGQPNLQITATPSSLNGKCSCAANVQPCEHTLGLLLLHAQKPDLFAALPTPQWADTTVEMPPPPDKNELSRMQRAQERKLAVAAGIDELTLFLRDVLRQGLLSLSAKDESFFEQIARRMVDAKAPGLAGRLRKLAAADRSNPDDPGTLVQIAQLWLLAEAFQHLDQLPEKMADDVRTALGWTTKKEDIVQAEKPDLVADQWLALYKKETREEDLDVTRTWLHGLESGRYALLIDYVHPSKPYNNPFRPGQVSQAELAFYPAAWPQRALLLQWHRNERTPTAFPEPLSCWKSAQAIWSNALAQAPLLEEMPFYIAGLSIVNDRQEWFLRDKHGLALPVGLDWDPMLRRQLLALSGGAPSDIYLLRRGMAVEPLGLIQNQQFHALICKP